MSLSLSRMIWIVEASPNGLSAERTGTTLLAKLACVSGVTICSVVKLNATVVRLLGLFKYRLISTSLVLFEADRKVSSPMPSVGLSALESDYLDPLVNFHFMKVVLSIFGKKVGRVEAEESGVAAG